ncbi:MAG: hypothetical protein HQM09_12670 [Candidatus Riflebacteria bacterium]|nr:hypothetical protein [Candidatus Riflebacteria bacterium]
MNPKWKNRTFGTVIPSNSKKKRFLTLKMGGGYLHLEKGTSYQNHFLGVSTAGFRELEYAWTQWFYAVVLVVEMLGNVVVSPFVEDSLGASNDKARLLAHHLGKPFYPGHPKCFPGIINQSGRCVIFQQSVESDDSPFHHSG